MIAPILRRVVFLVSVLLATAPAHALEAFAPSSLVIETASGGHFRFDVELADSPARQAQGLMFREAMAPDAGMLFTYVQPQQTAFWMKNTLIPLDMLFIAADGRVARIHERAVPGSLEAIPSGGPVKAVLEINGGMSARLGIRPGDRVLHPVFGNTR